MCTIIHIGKQSYMLSKKYLDVQVQHRGFVEFLDYKKELLYVGCYHTFCGSGILKKVVYDVIFCHSEGKSQGQ